MHRTIVQTKKWVMLNIAVVAASVNRTPDITRPSAKLQKIRCNDTLENHGPILLQAGFYPGFELQGSTQERSFSIDGRKASLTRVLWHYPAYHCCRRNRSESCSEEITPSARYVMAKCAEVHYMVDGEGFLRAFFCSILCAASVRHGRLVGGLLSCVE